ncbi:PP2C family protein-serine/threonine phosphatase [Pelagicoccus albus]|uniref:SpoIIE family protein phosphatase n=1 Tax=Pelagicoccus albus TaxID=415222 RepID=A0A7X1B5Z5_9BACT|nr:SpoIIE family protein phosphatase [Pelagicoccus albus]MBC2606250.1 SpoIIE family protein phosphatase [Pelagicoccus albus]
MPTPRDSSQITEMAISYDRFHRHLPVASFWTDLEHTIRGYNEKLAELVNLTETGESLSEHDLFALENSELLSELDNEAVSRKAPQTLSDFTAKLADGRELHLETSRIPLFSEDQEVIGLLVTYTDVSERNLANQKFAEQQAALEERNRTIEFDLDSAQQIQKFLMGKKPDACPFLEVASDYRYMEKVGGDYLNFRSLNNGDYSMFLADLTGHGVTAALFMALLKYVSQETPEEVRSLPGYFLNYLDMEFYEQIPNGFFTALSATARYVEEEELVRVDYSNASHPVCIVVRTDGSYELLKSGYFAIGLMDLVEREVHTVDLKFGDRLYAYTDGFIETLDKAGNEFGLDALCQTLASFRDLPLKESIAKTYQALLDYSESDEAQDDMTLLAIEAKEPDETQDQFLPPDPDPWGDLDLE